MSNLKGINFALSNSIFIKSLILLNNSPYSLSIGDTMTFNVPIPVVSGKTLFDK